MSLETREPEITELKSPIDTMYLLYKALRAEAIEAERMVYDLNPEDSLRPFRATFNERASVLAFHALMEDEHMTPKLPDLPQVRINVETHKRLEQYHQEVATCLDQEIGKSHVIPRTHRHLYGRVVRLQVAQDDHLEEEFVLPLIREKLSEDEQRRIARQILVDDEAKISSGSWTGYRGT